jgi:lipid-A-disaccharide synthase-like uncharacterized protein
MSHHLDAYSILWLGLGFAAQGLFGARFLVQWLYSEKHRKSVVPVMFWWFSVIGGVAMLIYSLHLRDPVIISGQAFGLIVYIRNIWLLYHERKSQARTLSATLP